MRRALVILVLIGLVAVSAIVAVVASDWPFWQRAWRWHAAPAAGPGWAELLQGSVALLHRVAPHGLAPDWVHLAARGAVDDRDRRAPVALARDAPVAQAPRHLLLAQAFGLEVGRDGVDRRLPFAHAIGRARTDDQAAYIGTAGIRNDTGRNDLRLARRHVAEHFAESLGLAFHVAGKLLPAQQAFVLFPQAFVLGAQACDERSNARQVRFFGSQHEIERAGIRRPALERDHRVRHLPVPPAAPPP